jgi:hypothetical protein
MNYIYHQDAKVFLSIENELYFIPLGLSNYDFDMSVFIIRII